MPTRKDAFKSAKQLEVKNGVACGVLRMGEEKVKFLYLKLGRGNCLAEYWLSKNNVFKKPAAAIYFRDITAEKCRELLHMSEKEIKERHGWVPDVNAIDEFIKAGDNAGKTGVQRTMFVTIGRGRVYIYEPEGHVFDMPDKKYKEYDDDLSKEDITAEKVRHEGEIKNIPKIMYVKNVKTDEVKNVPHVLATLPCNQYYSRHTCREINDWGAIQAIKYCLKQQVDTPENVHELMRLLSPYELETLVFLILRNAGLFVPAWRGGTQKDIDIIGRNLNDSQIKIPPVTFRPKTSLTFQVKRGKVKKHSEIADRTVATDFNGKNDKILTAEWLLKQIKTQPDTKKWFLNSLSWIPNVNSLIESLQNARASGDC